MEKKRWREMGRERETEGDFMVDSEFKSGLSPGSMWVESVWIKAVQETGLGLIGWIMDSSAPDSKHSVPCNSGTILGR